MKIQYQIFIAFFRSSLLGYGGGATIIPLVHKEVVGKFRWLDNDEFSEILALGNILPGPIITKLAGYLGYRVGGFLGMINALVAAILPSLIFMIVLMSTLIRYQEIPFVLGMKNAVLPVVGVMLMQLTWQFLQDSWQSLHKWSFFIHLSGWLFLTLYVKVHPAFIFGSIIVIALSYPSRKSKKGRGSREGVDS